MSGKWILRLWLAIGIVWAGDLAAEAASPWNNLLSVKKVEADPEQEYLLTEENGPWMIMACSFSGDGAEQQAKDLVFELRKRYKLPAFIHKARFDLGKAPGRGVDKYGNPKKWQYNKYKNRAKAEINEVAVLVGNYPTSDDSEAQETMKKIKYAKPQCLEIKDGKSTNQTLTGWRMLQKQVYEAMGSDKKKKGSMGHAFITANPLLPADYFAPRKGLDPLVLEMNKDAEYSLLNCPGKYTVQVATFKGQVVIKQDEIKDIQDGNKPIKNGLAAAADKAHRLAVALRMKHYEAYEFHDRYASIVTVGSFNSVGMPRADGRIEINPSIHKIMKTFKAEPKTLPGQTTSITPLKTCVGIPFDIQPIPVEVPKRSISTAMRSREW